MHDAYSKIISEASPQPLYSYAHCPFLGVRKWSDWQPSFKQIDANQSESKKKKQFHWPCFTEWKFWWFTSVNEKWGIKNMKMKNWGKSKWTDMIYDGKKISYFVAPDYVNITSTYSSSRGGKGFIL